MILIPSPRAVALAAACLVLAVGHTGCALRATTDFGPQSQSTTRSLSASPEGLPGGVSGVSGPEGNSLGLREAGGNPSGGAGETR